MKKRLAIINSDPVGCSYGGVAPIMRNMHDVLSKHFELEYFYIPESWKKTRIPCRLLVMIYLLCRSRRIRRCDFILSHIPEGSFVASYMGRPYAHIYHGNANPMEGSRYSFGKYFKWIFELFFKRIEKTADLRYTVGPVWDGVKKLYNPIVQDVKPVPSDQRSGFVFCGRLEAVKNIDRLIKLYSEFPAEIRARHPFHIAGFGTLEQELKAKVISCGLTDSVIFHGKVNNKDILCFDSDKKLLMMASSFEGFPTAIAEAMSVGVPVVTTGVGDIPQIVKDGINGRVLSVGCSDEEYVAAVIDVLSNYERYSAAALESSALFSHVHVTEAVVSDINDILQKN